MGRVDQAGGRDDGRAVLVVVEDGDVQQILQLGFDLEAFGGLDVLQVDAAPGVADVLNHGDEFIRIGGLHLDVEAVDVGEALEQHRLAFHHRLGRHVAQVAQAQDGGAVRDDGDHVALGGVVVGLVRIGGDGQDRHGHARRIGQRQVALGRHRLGRGHGDLARRRIAVELQSVVVGEGLFIGQFGHFDLGKGQAHFVPRSWDGRGQPLTLGQGRLRGFSVTRQAGSRSLRPRPGRS